MYKVNGTPNREDIEKFDNDRHMFYRFQNPAYTIEGEYTQSWGMIFGSAEEARECAEEWGLEEDEAVLPGKSCMTTFEEILSFTEQFGKNDVLMIFSGNDTYATGHDGEYVADFDEAVAIWSMEDVIKYAQENIWK